MTPVKFECNSCQGVYVDRSPDGGTYHHACPPLPPDKNGVVFERANKRDENVATTASGRVVGIISEGDGATCLSDARLPEPVWLTKLKDRTAREEAKTAPLPDEQELSG